MNERNEIVTHRWPYSSKILVNDAEFAETRILKGAFEESDRNKKYRDKGVQMLVERLNGMKASKYDTSVQFCYCLHPRCDGNAKGGGLFVLLDRHESAELLFFIEDHDIFSAMQRDHSIPLGRLRLITVPTSTPVYI